MPASTRGGPARAAERSCFAEPATAFSRSEGDVAAAARRGSGDTSENAELFPIPEGRQGPLAPEGGAPACRDAETAVATLVRDEDAALLGGDGGFAAAEAAAAAATSL